MSTPVTMRPRRFRTPAISDEDSGPRVSRSGMNTSWTREIGRPNSCPPIMAGTYSATRPSGVWGLLIHVLLGAPFSSRPVQLGGLFLQRRDQARTVELADIVMEAGLTAALDRGRRHQRGQADDGP